ncbi:polysaccharide deacetylase family protein [Clostridium lundense]|uniref:polysaccharide deacetylase family protein n=1 Tax=Clostridium lundense TaxID=319475 RepID=UPI00068447EC|nr:polysaccharide deacetylase family protein [Clostridium lundense]
MFKNLSKKCSLFIISFIFPCILTSCSKNLNIAAKDIQNNNTQVINKEINIPEKTAIDASIKPPIASSLNKETPKNVLNNRTFTGPNLKYNNKGIPVLMYHSIAYEKGNELRIPKEKFREQMCFLKEKGYTTLTLNELHEFFVNNSPVPEKSVVLTFDDGYVDNYTNAYPILKEFGFNAVVFVITNNIDNRKGYLTSNQIIELANNGIEVQSHTVDHEKLATLTYNKQLETLKNSKFFLENILGRKISYIAYPYGNWNENTIKAIKETDYKMAFTTNGTWSDKSDGIYTLDRVYISANFDINEFHRRLTNRNYK